MSSPGSVVMSGWPCRRESIWSKVSSSSTGKVAAQGQDGVERDRGVPLAEDEAVPLRPVRPRRDRSAAPKVERDQEVGGRERTAEVPGSRLVHGSQMSSRARAPSALSSSSDAGGWSVATAACSTTVLRMLAQKRRSLVLDAARAAEIGATCLCALGAVPGARVLLNDNPAGEVVRLQDIDDSGNIDDAITKLAEDDVAQGVE